MDIVRLKASHTEFKTFPSFKITLPHGSVSKRLNAVETATHAVKATFLWSDLPPHCGAGRKTSWCAKKRSSSRRLSQFINVKQRSSKIVLVHTPEGQKISIREGNKNQSFKIMNINISKIIKLSLN